jgi:hypothetical protein
MNARVLLGDDLWTYHAAWRWIGSAWLTMVGVTMWSSGDVYQHLTASAHL